MDNSEKLAKLVSEIVKKIENSPIVPVGVSNRHIHLSQEDVDILFGQGYALTLMKNLLQPGEFACNETLTLSGTKNSIANVRVLGPVRNRTQVEISLTDSLKLGAEAPVSESGRLEHAGEITVENPKTGAKVTKKCAISALRHIHMPPEFAEKYGFGDRQMVSVEFGGIRGMVFNEVLLRVSPNFCLEMHLDTDEANAAKITTGTLGRIL